ncbi:glycoside hydrolase family 28 protein [Labilibaculum euxinus]
MKLFCVFLLFVSQLTFGQNSVVDLKDAGADSKGLVNCSPIIDKIVAELSEQGGGEIYIPSGVYLSGPIELKSNITLNIGSGAVLKFSDDFDEYLPMIDSRWEGVRVRNFKSCIYSHNANNVTIKGRGLIDGNGEKWWDLWSRVRSGEKTNTKWEAIFKKENAEMLKTNEYLQGMGSFLRPPLFMPYNCTNVRVEGVTFTNPPFWTLMPVFSENVTIDGITILNPGDSPNTDGIDPSSCRNVRISNSHISVGDDCIVIKSGRDADGRDANRPTENITISNCTMLNGHGGVVIGSEMSGSVRRVAISNCVFEGTDRGIRIKTMRGRGGVVEDVRVSNVIMHNMLREGVMINMHYHETPEEPVSERTPAIRNVYLSNIRMTNANKGIAIYGLKERSAEQISFNDIQIDAKTGVTGDYASNIDMKNIRLSVSNGNAIEFNHSEKIQISDLTVYNLSADASVIKLDSCSDILVNNCFQPTELPVFIEGNQSVTNLFVINNILSGVDLLVEGDVPFLTEKGNIIKRDMEKNAQTAVKK